MEITVFRESFRMVARLYGQMERISSREGRQAQKNVGGRERPTSESIKSSLEQAIIEHQNQLDALKTELG